VTSVILSEAQRSRGPQRQVFVAGVRSRRTCVSSFSRKGGKPQRSSVLTVIVLTALLAIAPLPVHPQAKPPASRPSSPSGLYRIAGKLQNSVTGEPVRRAIVSVLAESDSHTIASVATDSDGHFALENLPAAKYQLTASRRGFRTAFYDEHDEFNTAIVTGPDQETESLIFRLTPGSVLHGVVTADGGDPVKDADVMLFRKPQAHKPGDRIAQAGSTTTDDTGAYEFGNLAAGEYLLAVKADPWYAIHPSQSRPPNDPTTALDVAYPITYFDSTSDEAQASSIVLSGGNREEADFNLHAVPALHITLQAPRSDDGSSPSSPPTLHQSIFGARDLTETTTTSTNSKQGLIEFSGVAPGRYELAMPDPPRVVNLDATISQQFDPAAEIPTVAVTGTLQTYSGSALPGETTVILDSLDPAHRESPIQTACTQSAFRFESVPPGSWQLSAINAGNPLPITAISAGSRANYGAQLTVRDHPLTLVVSIGLGETRVEGFARETVETGAPSDAPTLKGTPAPTSSLGWKGVPGVMIVLVPNTNSRPVWQALIRRDQSELRRQLFPARCGPRPIHRSRHSGRLGPRLDRSPGPRSLSSRRNQRHSNRLFRQTRHPLTKNEPPVPVQTR
jgi:hypothetical protein